MDDSYDFFFPFNLQDLGVRDTRVTIVFVMFQDMMVVRESDFKSRDFMDIKPRQHDAQPKVNLFFGHAFIHTFDAYFLLCRISNCHHIKSC